MTAQFTKLVFEDRDFGTLFNRCTFENVEFRNCLLWGALFRGCTFRGVRIRSDAAPGSPQQRIQALTFGSGCHADGDGVLVRGYSGYGLFVDRCSGGPWVVEDSSVAHVGLFAEADRSITARIAGPNLPSSVSVSGDATLVLNRLSRPRLEYPSENWPCEGLGCRIVSRGNRSSRPQAPWRKSACDAKSRRHREGTTERASSIRSAGSRQRDTPTPSAHAAIMIAWRLVEIEDGRERPLNRSDRAEWRIRKDAPSSPQPARTARTCGSVTPQIATAGSSSTIRIDGHVQTTARRTHARTAQNRRAART